MFEVKVPAVTESLAALRQELRTWLEKSQVADGIVDDSLLAVTEVVSNAIEHGHDGAGTGTVAVTASIAHGELRLTVQDSGTWRPPTDGPTDRGRGLQIVRAMMNEIDIEPSNSGTRVAMSRSLDDTTSTESACP